MMDIVERLLEPGRHDPKCPFKNHCYCDDGAPHDTVSHPLAAEAAGTILSLRARVDGLRGVIEHLENANDALAAKRSPATYLAMEAEARDELIMLDEARRNARAALAQEPTP